MQFNRMLVLAPHTDDGELGCGGTIARMAKDGTLVKYVAFSSANDSLPDGHPKDTLKTELMEATKILGLKQDNVECLDFKVREFTRHRQNVLDVMHDLRESFDPDIVFAPSLNDLHQDHKTVAEECRRMFKRVTVLGYEMPWNNISFDTQSFIILTQEDIRKKTTALKCYRSQEYREYLNEKFIEGLAITRGVQANVPYAEAFEVVRLVIG